MTEPARTPAPSRFAKLRAATDRVPTKWFAAIGTGLFLAVTAAFGGLAPVAAEQKPIAQLAAGETHEGPQVATSIQRAVLVDSLSGAGAFPAEGERLLVLLVEMENRWTQPVWTFGNEGAQRTVRLGGDTREATAVVREDDQTLNPWLQPGVPALLAFSWTVAVDAYADGDDLHVDLRDMTLYTGQLLFEGQSWGFPEEAAVVTIPIEDIGAGGSS